MPTKTKTKTPIAKAILKTKPKVVKNRIVLVLDTSGSMSHLRNDAHQAVNEMLENIRRQTGEQEQKTDVAIVFFDSYVETRVHPTDVAKVGPLYDYPIRGSTALRDGVGEAVRVIDDGDEDASYLVLTYTDGGENVSRNFSEYTIQQLVAQKQKLGNWTFAFQVPPGARGEVARQFGVPLDNVREWEQTRKGVEEVRRTTNAGIGSYMKARSLGKKSVESFYVTTDLSKVSAKTIKRELDDISDRFKVYTVGPEQSVKEFVEEKTGRPYVIGSAYYQLMKTEKVQPQKSVLIMEKGKKAVWGGNEARDLVGLPTDGVAHASVTPGNHSNYDVFVQSTSVNRKLPRGTRVLVDTTKTISDKPTWNHTAVSR